MSRATGTPYVSSVTGERCGWVRTYEHCDHKYWSRGGGGKAIAKCPVCVPPVVRDVCGSRWGLQQHANGGEARCDSCRFANATKLRKRYIAPEPTILDCLNCGKPFPNKSGSPLEKRCRDCYQSYKKEQSRKRDRAIVGFVDCPWCAKRLNRNHLQDRKGIIPKHECVPILSVLCVICGDVVANKNGWTDYYQKRETCGDPECRYKRNLEIKATETATPIRKAASKVRKAAKRIAERGGRGEWREKGSLRYGTQNESYALARLWLQRVEYYGWKCYLCSRRLSEDEWQADHVKPIAAGGSPFLPVNIRPVCGNCNMWKSSTWKGPKWAHRLHREHPLAS